MDKYVKFFLAAIILLYGCASTGNSNSYLNKAIGGIDGEPVIPRAANKIRIPVFRNLTGIAHISENLSLKLKEQVNMDGRLAVVPENIEADLRLDGIITGYEIQPIKFGNLGEPVRKRLRITASLKLIDLNKGKEIFFERSVQAFDEFSDKIPPIITEMKIRDKVVDMLAKRITLKTINGWYTRLMTPVEKGKK